MCVNQGVNFNLIIKMAKSVRKGDYTYDEKKMILQYIIETKSYTSLRGNTFWQQMEHKKIVNRTWQSAKEHFRKKIIDKIHTIGIPNEERERIKEGWAASRAPAHKRQKTKCPRHAVDMKFSDDENDNTKNDGSDVETTKTRRKNTQKKEYKRIYMPKNVFSDEEDEEKDDEKKNEDVSSHDSPDLLNMGRVDKSTPDIDEIIIISDEEIDEGLMRKEAPSFSPDEDILLINYMKSNKTHLERKERLYIYESFQDIYPDAKPSKMLRRRFLLHILPNLCNYNHLSPDEMIEIYDEAHMKIPQNLMNLLENKGRNSKLFQRKYLGPNHTVTSACGISKLDSGVEHSKDTEKN